jgi:hypothetical protein
MKITKNMKATKWTAKTLASLLVVVGVAMVVVAAGVFISNTLIINNHVTGLTLTQVPTVFGATATGVYYGLGPNCIELPIGTGNVSMGVTYLTGINLTSPSNWAGPATAHFQIAKTGISIGDITVRYGNRDGSPNLIVMTMTDLGNTLVGTLGLGDVPPSYGATLVVVINYSTPGDYAITMWMEPT